MKLSQPVKILVGLATIWLIAYPVMFIGFMFLMPYTFMMSDSAEFMPFTGFGIIFPLHCLTMIISLSLMVFYLIHVIKNRTASETVRAILGVGIFFMPYIVMPVYYYLYIWRDVPPDWAIDKPATTQTETWSIDEPTIAQLKEEEPAVNELLQSKKNIWVILSVVGVILLLCLAGVGVASYQLSTFMQNQMAEFEYLYDFPPETVSFRTIQDTDGLSLLWGKTIDIENLHKSWVEFFMPAEQTLVFWSPQTETLVSLDMVSGDTNWEVAVPNHSTMTLHDDTFFVSAYDWLDVLEDAPNSDDPRWPNCKFGGKAALVTYDPYTGEQLWGYVYRGVDSYDMTFDEQSAYLTGSGDHGSSRSLAQIDADTGELLYLDCYKWPDEKEMPRPPTYDGDQSPLQYYPVYDPDNEFDTRWGGNDLSFIVHGTRLDMMEGDSDKVLGSLYFEGADLTSWMMDVVVKDDVVIVYLQDSDQLYGFRMPALVD